MKLFWKALLWATIIELVVLALTVLPMLRSFMSHSSADSNSFSNNLLARVGIYFHFPSFLIVTPFGGFLFAPLIQILLMAAILYLRICMETKTQIIARRHMTNRWVSSYFSRRDVHKSVLTFISIACCRARQPRRRKSKTLSGNSNYSSTTPPLNEWMIAALSAPLGLTLLILVMETLVKVFK